jgi:exodeoxyribonuclease-3
MKIATWNVNGLRARIDQLTGWLARKNPDVVCLQETKVVDEQFPIEELREAGYEAVFTGQRSYNGVALLARFGLGIEDRELSLPGDPADEQRRYVAATIEGVRVVDVYVPNGQEVGSPAFAYKLAWLRRLRDHLEARAKAGEALVVCGDFNVAPEPLDVHNPKKWEGQVLCHPDERARLRELCDLGLTDAFRAKHAGEAGAFTWWDYRLGAFKRNWGLRIDLVLASAPAMERVRDAWIDRAPRELERPSDHTPVMVELA